MAEVASNQPQPRLHGTTAEVQAGLQEYLSNQNLNTIFVDLVENILLEKPNNSIGFIVKYLIKKYPKETTEIIPKSNHEMKRHPMSSDDESSDSESDEDEVTSKRYRKQPSATSSFSSASGVRRTSVCAEKLSITTTLETTEVKNIPKTEEEAERIQEILKKNVLFQHLDEQQLLTVQNAMFLVEKEKNDVIIQQGDFGDNFYILEKGNVNVFIQSKDVESEENNEGQTEKGENNEGTKETEHKEDTLKQKQKLVKKYEDGDSFGELAIMYNAPRAATCIADGSVRLWALDRSSFKVILLQTTIEKRNKHKGFLQQVSLLSEMTEYELLTLADALQEDFFEDDTTIFKEGDKGDKFYIVKSGKALCFKTNNSTGEEVQVAELSNGSYFGEIALITSKSRQATVKASCNLKCLCLDRKTFKRVMGPLQDILKRNIESYNKFQAANI